MRQFILLLTTLFLTSCAEISGTFDGERPLKAGLETKTITLLRTYDASEECTRLTWNKVPPGRKAIACASWGETNCLIRIKPDASDEVLGHEVRHCFDGSWHR